MTYLTHIAARALNRPLLIHPRVAETIAMVLGSRIGVAPDPVAPLPGSNRFFGQPKADGYEIIYRVVDGVAVIPIVGELINRGAWIGAASGLVTYEAIAAQLALALADDQVKGIVLDIESPGGEAAGLDRLAGDLAATRGRKPIVAFVNDFAFSAAYWIAAQCDQIIVSQTSMVGSIGVVVLHVDHSGKLDQAGIKPTLIFAGAHKVDGHPFGPLPDSVRADLQREVEVYYDRFAEAVAAGRGARMSANQAKATEARIFIGADAIASGLADRLGTLADAVAAASQVTLAPPGAQPKRSARMATENDTVTRADHDAAVAAAVAAARTEGAAAAHARLAAILADPKVKGREAAAVDLAIKSPSMAAADVAAFVETNVPAGGAGDFAARLEAAARETSLGPGAVKPAPAKSAIDPGAIFSARAEASRR